MEGEKEMRTLNVVFDDSEYEEMEKIKELENQNWHDLIIVKIIGKKQSEGHK